jgi:hypothetical protein
VAPVGGTAWHTLQCLPRHPPQFRPSFLEFSSLAALDEASIIWQRLTMPATSCSTF